VRQGCGEVRARVRAFRPLDAEVMSLGAPHPVPPKRKTGNPQDLTGKRECSLLMRIIVAPCDAMRIPCTECGESSLDTVRGRCPKCHMRDFRRRHRMKGLDCRNCGVSGLLPGPAREGCRHRR
jgi:hypothetical protein